MIGIVLWRDVAAGKAIIWCEDQGDLAFYTHPDTIDTFVLCVGDWVIFDLKLSDDIRLAVDIRVLQEPGCPELVADLVGEEMPAVLPFAPKAAPVRDSENQGPVNGDPGRHRAAGGQGAAVPRAPGPELPANVVQFPAANAGGRKTA